MKNNKNITGPDCPGPNCPPPKSGKLGPGQLGPRAQLSGFRLFSLTLPLRPAQPTFLTFQDCCLFLVLMVRYLAFYPSK